MPQLPPTAEGQILYVHWGEPWDSLLFVYDTLMDPLKDWRHAGHENRGYCYCDYEVKGV